MAEIVLVTIGAHETHGRQVFNTGLSTVGRGGNDYLCGHCGHPMMTNFDANRLEVDIVFQCGSCGGYNVKPSE